MTAFRILQTGLAALVLSAAFLFGFRLHAIHDRRNMLSFGSGMSIAYVFVHVMPELHHARSAVVETVKIPLRYGGMSIYMVALLGFMLLYGHEHMRERALAAAGGIAEPRPALLAHVSGFAAYVALVSYLLVHNLSGHSEQAMGVYVLAMTGHFLGLDHSLTQAHGAPYLRVGRYMLAAAALLGWAFGLVVVLPRYVLALLFAFISGAIIVNSAIMELPHERGGRFLPFLLGGLFLGAMLWVLG